MMQSKESIILRKLSFKRDLLDHVDFLAALDRGCSLTKIVYVDKADSGLVGKGSSAKYVKLTLALFQNNQFNEALLWLKNNALFPISKDIKFHVTGTGGTTYRKQIADVLEREVEFVHELICQCQGAYHLLKDVPINDITYPLIKCNSDEILNVKKWSSQFDKVKVEFKRIVGEKTNIQSEDDILPCIFAFFGSAGVFTIISKEGKIRLSVGFEMAGKQFIGLARCLLGTNNYKEITEMAAKGDRRNVDMEVDCDNVLPDFPISNFSILAETKRSIKDFKKEDIAHSLVSMFALNTLITSVNLCKAKNITNIFIGGNFFQAEIFRKEFNVLQRALGIDYINVYFVNNGHTGAVGAMLSSVEDASKFFDV